ncbi:sigma-54-dependent Fis family transcriptional regulator [Elioraea sp.]|jgi:DNA-binding NtrC family response regulator|uniref:sigma-54 interaction domain-containing protein n=1 Tax=Elioraea sp. TaxID=2185103 RepID=UPI0021DBE1A0|nr:sigma-54 dependent transcriptional regulator [Elioraea sp.]GIX10070.1 MAG: sigma-54-dependent Fis family transcriptional regulator [Elioraea sp.]
MRVMIVGSMSAELGEAARIAISRGARITQADDVVPALAQLRSGRGADVVLCDVQLAIEDLIAAMAAERIAAPVIACGTRADAVRAAAAIRAGAREYLPLPPDAELIAAMLETIGGDGRAPVAADPVMLAALRRAEQVAASEASVLIRGESGTGKEVMARHIHRRSRRAAGPFIAVNCAAIPENLLESELFGHEKGAFSGAIARRIGRFEAADGGTLLLDEISEMDVRLQAKLLRAIQEREIDRLGGSEPVKVNVRILATTNRPLEAEVRKGTFREDLYFRLNVVTLTVPPLRERPRDIAPLAEMFARRYAEVNGLAYRPLSAEAVRLLEVQPWRGNVRELENTIHRAVLLATGETIGVEAIELPQDETAVPAAPGNGHAARAAPSPAPAGTLAGLVGRTVADVERDLILETLTHCLGNRTHAAAILGISIRTLRNKLREYTAAGVKVPAAGLADRVPA